jgi:hypothetical protein
MPSSSDHPPCLLGFAGLFCVARPMVSSKLLRRPTRGAVGNGLRVCLGFLTATGGSLVVETSNIRVTLAPEIDGTSRIVSRETIETIKGLTLTAVAREQLFIEEHLAWALDAIELARQSGKPAFSGRPSPHWFDCDHFRVLLHAAVGPVSVRQFLAQLDGCQGSRAQTRIAEKFLRRTAASLGAAEAAELLAAAQAAVKPPKARALCPLGRDAVPCDGYAIAEGAFTEGSHEPRAVICFIVETWANAYRSDEQWTSLTAAVYMNRTRALIPPGGSVRQGWLELTIGSTGIQVPVPDGPHYSFDIAITSPMFRLTSDGKQPDCAPFADALSETIGKAGKAAGREIAALMTAQEKQASARCQQQQHDTEQQQRLADREARERRKVEVEQLKAERRAMPTIHDVVMELLPDAVAIESDSGLPFNTRRLVYRIRDRVLRRTGKELTQGYFDDLLTEIEAEQGDLSPLLYREARGNFLIPHQDNRAMPLGTLTVREFRRSAWTFNKVLLIEKDDLRYMLEMAGWAERHDCLIMSSKGFSTRAARDLIDLIADTGEPVQVFCVHDADAAGTLIQHTLQHETKARGARKIEVIDLGLQPWEGVALDLAVERVLIDYRKDGKPRKRPVGQYVCERTDLIGSETWEQWLQHARVELNAFTSAELIAWLDEKMAQPARGKVIPPDDVLQDGFASGVRERVCRHVASIIEAQLDSETARIEAEIEKISLPIEAEIQRVTAPLQAEIADLSKPFRTQIEQLTEPFKQQIKEAEAKAAAFDRVAEAKERIQKISPAPEVLKAAVADSFTKRPQLQWSDALCEIAAATKVGD